MAQIYYYDPQSAVINMQSPQSESTPRRLTLPLLHGNKEKDTDTEIEKLTYLL